MNNISLIFTIVFMAIFSEVVAQTNDTTSRVQHITPQQMHQKMSEDPGVLIDVRTPEEIVEGKIEGALEKDLFDEDFEAVVDTIDRNKPVYLYCAVGGRSSDAADILFDKGFTEVYNLKGGIYQWEEENLPTVIPEE